MAAAWKSIADLEGPFPVAAVGPLVHGALNSTLSWRSPLFVMA